MDMIHTKIVKSQVKMRKLILVFVIKNCVCLMWMILQDTPFIINRSSSVTYVRGTLTGLLKIIIAINQ